MANGEFKTVSATPLNEQQYLPTLKNLMSFKSELLGMSVKLFRFSKLPFCIVNNGSDVISVQTNWDIDNGGYRVKNIKYPAGTTTNLTVSLSLPANSIVIVDVNTLNGENIDVQGSLIRSNFTSSPERWNLSIKFTGRTNQILSDIRYMPLVIHLG